MVFHFYIWILYHFFLGIGRLCFGTIQRPEIQKTKETVLYFIVMRVMLLVSTMDTSGDLKPVLIPSIVWLTLVAFLRGLLSLCNTRFDHVGIYTIFCIY